MFSAGPAASVLTLVPFLGTPKHLQNAVRGDLRAQRRAWYNEAKFGMFIHWGLYSMLARNEPGQLAEWVMHNEHIPVEKYEPLADLFNPTYYNPESWVALAKSAGMRYIVITSKHHDGFCLFDSTYTDYDAKDRGPRRDLLEPLVKACQKEGIKICFYHSMMDWHHPDYPANLEKFVTEYLHPQVRELCTKYGKIDGIWFDGEWDYSCEEWHSDELISMIREQQPLAFINDRLGKGERGTNPDCDFFTQEQTVPDDPMRLAGEFRPWEVCDTFGHSWGYTETPETLKSVATLVRHLIDIASKGGNLLLNVGPMANGLIPRAFVERLYGIGRWMAINGESIYGTGSGPFGKFSFGCMTSKGKVAYLHIFECDSGSVTIPGRLGSAKRACLLDGGAPVHVTEKDGEVNLCIPMPLPDPIATVVKIELE